MPIAPPGPPIRSLAPALGLPGLLFALMAVPAAAQSILDDESLTLRSDWARPQVLDALARSRNCDDEVQTIVGAETRRALTRIIAATYAECEAASKTQNRRFEVKCDANDEDIGAAMVREGVALAITDFRWRSLLNDWLASIDGLGFKAHSCEKAQSR